MQATLYLKYRPTKISDLDLTEVREMMSKMLAGKTGSKSGKLPHAWLFSGPRGTGKTSTARILAKVLNCERREGFEPCNECEMCRDISAGQAVDVTEIDAASNRGIDEIRELKERIRLAPMRGMAKVYIIDEVHMLTTEAANALLKTLEEPPENTYFILCTTEADKLPDTVVSRCTRVVFRKPNVTEAVTSLKRVVSGEGIKATDEALEMLVKAAKGSFRDATKFLEQVSMSATEVTALAVKQALGVVTTGESTEYVDLVEEGDVNSALELISALDGQGINFRRFVEAVADIWREKLIVEAEKAGPKTGWYLKALGDLDSVYEQMKSTVIPQLPLEMFTIRIGENTGGTKAPIGGPKVEKDKKTNEVATASEDRGAEEVKKAEVVTVAVAQVEVEETEMVITSDGGEKYTLADLETKWGEILKAVRPKNHSVEALLRSTRPVTFNGGRLELEVFYKFHKDKLETEKCRSIVETAVANVFEVPKVKLYLKLGAGRKKKEEVTAEGVGEDIVAAAAEIFGAEAV